jgi:hypothetical protein
MRVTSSDQTEFPARSDSAHSKVSRIAAPALTTLELWSCAWLSDAAIAHLERCRTLTKVTIIACPGVTDAGLVILARLPALRSLDVSQCWQRSITNAGLPRWRRAVR